VVCLAAALFGLWPLVEGRAWSRPAVDLSAPPAPGTVRVVSFNIGPENPLWREDLARVLSWRPDLIVLIEIPVPLNRHVNRRTLGELDGWNREHRRWVDGLASPGFVLTREELERLPTPGTPQPGATGGPPAAPPPPAGPPRRKSPGTRPTGRAGRTGPTAAMPRTPRPRTGRARAPTTCLDGPIAGDARPILAARTGAGATKKGGPFRPALGACFRNDQSFACSEARRKIPIPPPPIWSAL
jgi:hypothetical protein